MPEYKQDFFVPTHPEKCLNCSKYGENPFYRSSWEQRVFSWMDLNANVIKWGAELPETVIEYYLPLPNGMKEYHRYVPDIFAVIKERDGNVRKYLIEVKPMKDGKPPKEPKRKTKKAMQRYNHERAVYIKNSAKWEYAKRWCAKREIIFKVFTENVIFSNRRKT